MAAHRSFLRDNGLGLVLGFCFILLLCGQIITGWHVYNEERTERHQSEVTMVEYLGTGHFAEALFENWESEFLQMGAYVLLTVGLFQRGSSESKDPDGKEEVDDDPNEHRSDPGAPSPVRHGGWRLALYRNSLSIGFALLFFGSIVGHALGGVRMHNEERVAAGVAPFTLGEYVGSSDFWFESFQNWQSEFLAVLSIVILSVRLRQYGSPESKPVHAPHTATGNGG